MSNRDRHHPERCPVCSDARRAEIESTLLGGAAYMETARRFELSNYQVRVHAIAMPEMQPLLRERDERRRVGVTRTDYEQSLPQGRPYDDPADLDERRQCALLLRSGATSVVKAHTSRLDDVEELTLRSSPLAVVMRWAARLLEEEDRGLARLSVTGIERRILWLLEDVGRLTVEEIAQKLGMPSRDIAEHTRPLLSAGFVRRAGRTLEAT